MMVMKGAVLLVGVLDTPNKESIMFYGYFPYVETSLIGQC